MKGVKPFSYQTGKNKDMELEGILNLDDQLVFDELYCPEVHAIETIEFGADENLLEGLSPRKKHTKSVLKLSQKHKMISPLDTKQGRSLNPNKSIVNKASHQRTRSNISNNKKNS